MIRVSWLIPVRDHPLDEALASIELGPNDEVVIVDDGSREPVPGAIRQPPRGIVAALERGRAVCRGEFIARLDADDIALPGRIDAQLAALEADPGLVAVGGRARIETAYDGMRTYVDQVNAGDPMRDLLVESPMFHPAVTFRAAAVQAIDGYRGTCRGEPIPEDYDLWLRLVRAGGRLANVDHEVLVIRDRENRLTRTHEMYSREAFRRAREAFLGPRLKGRRVAIYGAGKKGRAWMRCIEAYGGELAGVFDIKSGGERRGLPIRSIHELTSLQFHVLLVAVPRSALPRVRARLCAIAPDLVETRDWWAVG
ncbi:MAG: glycosyltransferase [Proteobacteria bacterium]|nr:glycosyltransferase [Pseudomonadota bacterium]MCP4917607.1 glycosyltransferase [Pseudomonadota bacterium]